MNTIGMADTMRTADIRRRSFIKRAAAGTAGVALGTGFGGFAEAAPAVEKARVSVTAGTDRRAMVYDALKPFGDEVRKAVRGRRVIVKPNMVVVTEPLCATHADALRGVLDFLKPIVKDEILIAESTISKEGSLKGFENYGYVQLAKEYRVSFMDLNTRPSTTAWILGKDHHPLGKIGRASCRERV